jgi:hypothetical protein
MRVRGTSINRGEKEREKKLLIAISMTLIVFFTQKHISAPLPQVPTIKMTIFKDRRVPSQYPELGKPIHR